MGGRTSFRYIVFSAKPNLTIRREVAEQLKHRIYEDLLYHKEDTDVGKFNLECNSCKTNNEFFAKN